MSSLSGSQEHDVLDIARQSAGNRHGVEQKSSHGQMVVAAKIDGSTRRVEFPLLDTLAFVTSDSPIP